MALPLRIIRVMRGQLGLVTRTQVLDSGVPRSTLDSWVRRGVLEPVEMGVYRHPGSAPPREQALMAAALRAGDGARITGWSACALHGLEGFARTAVPWVAIAPTRRVRGVQFIVQRTVLARADLATVAGLPSVTPIRAIIDAAKRVDDRAVRVGIDDGCRRRLIQLRRLLARAEELGPHPGAARIRRLCGDGLLDQDGELERRLALALAAEALFPAWGMEVLPGVIVDACFPEASYVLECDGRQWHTISTDRAADVTREGALRADGWEVSRITAADLSDRPDATVAYIRGVRQARIDAGLGRPQQWRPVRQGRRIRPVRAR